VFQSTLYALCNLVIRAFGVWAEAAFGAVGRGLVYGASARVRELQSFWNLIEGRQVAAQTAPLSAFDEYQRDLASEKDKDEAKKKQDDVCLAEVLVRVCLAYMQPIKDEAASADVDILSLLPDRKEAQWALHVAAPSEDPQLLFDHACWRLKKTVEDGRPMRLGESDRNKFSVFAKKGVASTAAIHAIPAEGCFKPCLPLPTQFADVVDVVEFGLLPNVPISHIVATFLRRTAVLDTAAARRLRQQGQAALVVDQATQEFARQQADRRKAELGTHPVVPWLTTHVPTDMFPDKNTGDTLIANVLTRLLRQTLAAGAADCKVLDTAAAALTVLQLPLADLAAAAKVRASVNGIVHGTATSCKNFRSSVPALAPLHTAVTASMLALKKETGGATSLAAARVVVSLVRARIQQQHGVAAAALAAGAPVDPSDAQQVAAFAAKSILVNAFLDKLVAPAERISTAGKVPTLNMAASHLPAVRVLNVYQCVVGYHRLPPSKHKHMGDEEKKLIEYVTPADVDKPGEPRRRLFSMFLAAETMAKAYKDGWAPTSLCYTGLQLNATLYRKSVVTAREQQPVEKVLFRDRYFSRANIDTLGKFVQSLLGADWFAIDFEVWLEIGDVLLSLLFGVWVGHGSPGFLVQEQQLSSLLSATCNAARPNFQSSFTWLVSGLRVRDPGRFAVGGDPG
jgi:hypothetical protein